MKRHMIRPICAVTSAESRHVYIKSPRVGVGGLFWHLQWVSQRSVAEATVDCHPRRSTGSGPIRAHHSDGVGNVSEDPIGQCGQWTNQGSPF
eukprot:1153852-Pyramimonas_sp.AAC.1